MNQSFRVDNIEEKEQQQVRIYKQIIIIETMDKVVNFFENLTNPATIDIRVDAKPTMKFMRTKAGGKKNKRLPVFMGDDSISGVVELKMPPDSEIEHFGLKVYLQGFLKIYSDEQLSTEFHSLSKELLPTGTLRTSTKLKFKFNNFDKDYETYYGQSGEVRYMIKVVLAMDKYLPNVTKQVHFAVYKPIQIENMPKEAPIKMQVGSEGRVNIHIDVQKNCFHLKDCIIGNIHFNQVSVTLRSMEVWLIRKQSLGSEQLNENHTQNLIKYEIMDGCPQVGQTIPVRLYLNGVYGLSPSFKSLHNRLTVTYSLNFVLVEESGKKYFKQAPITLYRRNKNEQ